MEARFSDSTYHVSLRNISMVLKTVLHDQMSLETLLTQLPFWRLMEISILKALRTPAINVSFYLIHCFPNLLDFMAFLF